MGRFLVSLLFLASLLPAQPPASALTPDQWRADLAFLAKELPARHVNAFAHLSRAEFDAKVRELDGRISNLSDAAIRAGILKLVAALGDAHTNASVRGNALPLVPLIFYWYKDGVFVTAALEANRTLLGSKLVRVGRLGVDEACRSLGDYVPHENDSELKAQVPSMLMRVELLQAIGAMDKPGSVHLEFQPPTGAAQAVDIEPALFHERPQWVWAFTGEPPLFQQDRDLPYSVTSLEGGNVYFRYNKCLSDLRKPFPKFAEEMKNFLSQPGVTRFIIDLRNNSGGNSAVLDPFIAWLKTSPVNQKGKLFVLIGRQTFSSAVLNAVKLKNDTAAILAGEPTGGKPNHFGEVKSFQLPNSHIGISYSTKYFHDFKDDTPSLAPDIPVEPTSHDYMTGADPVLDTVLKQPAN
jgi:hypothetical protein